MLELWQRAHVDAPRRRRPPRDPPPRLRASSQPCARCRGSSSSCTSATRSSRRSPRRATPSRRCSSTTGRSASSRASRPRTRSRSTAGSSSRLLDLRAQLGVDRARADRGRRRRPPCSSTRSAGASSAPRLGVAAAASRRCNPYLVWHDVHVNREILDQLVRGGARAADAARRRAAARCGSPSLLGVVSGLAMLGNTRLVFIPVLCAVYLAWRLPRARVGARSRSCSPAPRSPSRRGSCATRRRRLLDADDRRPRPLEGEQRRRRTTCSRPGQWIDDVRPTRRVRRSRALTPEEAHGVSRSRARAKLCTRTNAAQMRFYEHLASQFVPRPSRREGEAGGALGAAPLAAERDRDAASGAGAA